MTSRDNELVPLGQIVTDLVLRPRLVENGGVIAALEAWSEDAKGAFARNTERALRADWRVFAAYCQQVQQVALPASAETVRDFVRHSRAAEKRPATIRRYLASIARAHRAANCENPCQSEKVKLAMRSVTQELGAAQAQARALTWSEIADYLKIQPLALRDHRDRALVALAYDSMCRSEEVVAIELAHLTRQANGSGRLAIARSKTDQAGEGATVFVSRTTMDLITDWQAAAGLRDGALFPRVIGSAKLGERLNPAAVASVMKRIGRFLRLPKREVDALSGHSTRVGATQDLLAHNAELTAVMQSGRWTDPRMVLRYGKDVMAERGAMARLATEQGR